MRVQICAVGRLRAGPEATLISDYAQRFDRTARAYGIGPLRVTEVESRKSNAADEATLLDRALPDRALLCALDERGKRLSSPELAQQLARWRDAGNADLAFIIGGADGLDAQLRARADFALSFGPMVWPHMLARVMLAEQLYRAASILAGSPYHRA